jgi:hypothetical protein
MSSQLSEAPSFASASIITSISNQIKAYSGISANALIHMLALGSVRGDAELYAVKLRAGA